MRFCIDYRKVELIKKDKFPLPKIDTCLDTLNGCQYYSCCDLRWGYWQTKIDERDCRNSLSPVRGNGALNCLVGALQCTKPICLHHETGNVGFDVRHLTSLSG